MAGVEKLMAVLGMDKTFCLVVDDKKLFSHPLFLITLKACHKMLYLLLDGKLL